MVGQQFNALLIVDGMLQLPERFDINVVISSTLFIETDQAVYRLTGPEFAAIPSTELPTARRWAPIEISGQRIVELWAGTKEHPDIGLILRFQNGHGLMTHEGIVQHSPFTIDWTANWLTPEHLQRLLNDPNQSRLERVE